MASRGALFRQEWRWAVGIATFFAQLPWVARYLLEAWPPRRKSLPRKPTNPRVRIPTPRLSAGPLYTLLFGIQSLSWRRCRFFVSSLPYPDKIPRTCFWVLLKTCGSGEGCGGSSVLFHGFSMVFAGPGANFRQSAQPAAPPATARSVPWHTSLRGVCRASWHLGAAAPVGEEIATTDADPTLTLP